jgi:hypothetical protein
MTRRQHLAVHISGLLLLIGRNGDGVFGRMLGGIFDGGWKRHVGVGEKGWVASQAWLYKKPSGCANLDSTE